MKEEEKYRDFIDLEDTSEDGLVGLFVKRSFIMFLKSPMKEANQISITHFAADGIEIYNPDAKPSSYDDRLKVLGLLDKNDPGESITINTASVHFPFDYESEFAEYELAILNPSEITDPFLLKRVEAYLKVCRGVLKQKEAEKNKDITLLKLTDLKNRELAAYFFYNRIDVTRKNIRRILKEHGIDREIKKPEDIVENIHLWDKWSGDSTWWRYGKNASKNQRQHLNENYLRVKRFLTGPALARLKADYEVFLSYSPKK